MAPDTNIAATNDYNALKRYIQASETLTITSSGSTQTRTYPHGLGYVPRCRVTYTAPNGRTLEAIGEDDSSSFTYDPASTNFTIAIRIDDTNLYLDVENGTGSAQSIATVRVVYLDEVV